MKMDYEQSYEINSSSDPHKGTKAESDYTCG